MFKLERSVFILALALLGLASLESIDAADADGQLIRGSNNDNARQLGFLSSVFCRFRNNCDGDGDIVDQDTNKTDTGDDQDEEPRRFFGQHIFGPDGFFGSLFGNTDGNSTDDNYGGGNGTDDGEDLGGPFGFGILPEGGLLSQVINRDDDTTFIEALRDAFTNSTQQYSSGYLEDWYNSVNLTDTVCNNTESGAPECLAANGQTGFFVSRTLFNPFTGEPSSDPVCITEGYFMENVDSCECSVPEGEIEPVCPEVCPCACDFLEIDDGVLIKYNATWFSPTEEVQQCVSQSWATSVTTGVLSEKVFCVSECPL
jgi:hypothetical protein